MGKKEHRSNISLAQEAEQQLAGNYYGFVGIPSATFVFFFFSPLSEARITGFSTRFFIPLSSQALVLSRIIRNFYLINVLRVATLMMSSTMAVPRGVRLRIFACNTKHFRILSICTGNLASNMWAFTIIFTSLIRLFI